MGCINTSNTQSPRNAKKDLSRADPIQQVNSSPPVQSAHPLTDSFPPNSQVYPTQYKKNSIPTIPTIPSNENTIQRFSHRQSLNIQQPQFIDRFSRQQTQNINLPAQRVQQQDRMDRIIAEEAPIQVREQDLRVQPLQIIPQQQSVISARHEIRQPIPEQQIQNEEGESRSQNSQQFESFMIGPFLIISIGQSNFVLVVRNNQNRNNGLSQQCEAPNNEETCSICQQQIKKKQKIIILTCVHQFHEICLVPWLKNSDNCPMCRKSVRGNNN